MEKNCEWRDVLDFTTCQRPDGTYYGHGGAVCHKGTQATLPEKLTTHVVFDRMTDAQKKSTLAAIEDFRGGLLTAGYQEDAIETWDSAVGTMLQVYSEDWGRTDPWTGQEVEEGTKAILARADREIVGKMPTHLEGSDGSFFEASLQMRPDIKAKQLGWRDPIVGGKYGVAYTNKEKEIKTTERKLKKATKDKDEASIKAYQQRLDRLKKLPDGATISKKNGVASDAFNQWREGNDRKMLSYKEKLEKQGKKWPAEPSRTPTEAEITALVQANPNLYTSGFNISNRTRGRDDAFDVYELGNKNPSPAAIAARDGKNRAIAGAYLQHNGRSPVTGETIILPKSSAPGGKTVVDHVDPISSFFKPGRPMSEVVKLADTRKNYVVVESDLNNSKNKRSWDQTAATFKRRGDMDTNMRRQVTNNWNEAGSKAMLSRKEFETRFGSSKGLTDPSYRQALASNYEQRRLTKIFGGERQDMVPTQRTSRSSSVSKGFTSPKGSLPTPKAAPAPKPVSSPKTSKASKPAPKKVGATSRTQTQAKARTAQANRQREKLVKKQEDLRSKRKIIRDKANARGGYTKKMTEAFQKLGNDLRKVEADLES